MARKAAVRMPRSEPADSNHNHICAFFHDQEEEYHVLLPFIKKGFEKNDKAFHIVDPKLRQEHLHRLQTAGIDVKAAEKRRQLEVKGWHDAYLKRDHFDQIAMATWIEDVLKAGPAQGFSSTRLIAHMEWILEDRPSVEDFLEYEARLNYVLPQYNDSVVCVYNASKFDAGVIMDILRTHPVVMISGVMQRNPFFVPPDQLLEELRVRRAGPKLIETGIVAENRRCRRAIRDLMAWSSMPATWIGRVPEQVAEETLGILMRGLQLDAAFMRLKGGDGAAVEVLHAGDWLPFSEWVHSLDAKGRNLEGIPGTRRLALSAGGRTLNMVQIPIGIEMEAGYIVVGSPRADFPTEMETMALSVAANQGMVSFENSRLLHEHQRVETELEILKEEVDHRSMFENIKGSSPALKEVLSKIAKVAPTDSTVLITGETGTGKELVATAIHRRSQRAKEPFISLNCAALAPSLIASELFGHEKGSFTGAVQRRLGRFELANGGTIFLDEVGELSLETQVALLRVLQERVIERVGGTQQTVIDVRILTATNRNLEAAVAAGSFRADLFYRLNVFPINVPPLRNRKEDIPALARHFVQVYAAELGKRIRSIDRSTMRMLQTYQWPGNVRELQNIIERSLILSEGEVFSVDPAWMTMNPSHHASGSLSQRLEDHERGIVESALTESRGKVSGVAGAASRLGIPPTTLESRIKALGINKHRFK